MRKVETTLFGIDYEYLLFDVTFDGPLYRMYHATCGCGDVAYCFGKHDANVTSVDESGLDIVTMAVGEWIDFSITDDSLYLKVSLDNTGLDCPKFILDFNQDLNGAVAYSAFGRIPSDEDYDRFSVNYASKQIICPEDPNYVFGDLYIVVYPGYPETALSTGRIRVLQFETEACEPYDVETGTVHTPLYDGVTDQALIEPDTYDFYQIRVDDSVDCTKFALYTRSNDPDQPGDFDVFISTISTEPTLEEGYEWASFNDVEEYTVVTEICNPSPGDPFYIYIGVYAFGSDTMISYDVTASLNSGTYFYEDISAYGTMNNFLNFISSAIMDCEEDILYCEFVPYENCENEVPYRCCHRFFPVMPLVNGSNPFMLFEVSDPDLFQFYSNNENFLQFPELVSNSVSFGVKYSKYDGTEYTRYLHAEPSQCKLKWVNFLTDSDHVAITDTVTFEVNTGICEIAGVTNVINEFGSLTQDLENADAVDDVLEYTRQLSFIPFGLNWYYCVASLDQYLISEDTDYVIENSTSCFHSSFSDDFTSDPCCDINAAIFTCCVPTDQVINTQEITASNTELIENQCIDQSCAQNLLDQYVELSDNCFPDSALTIDPREALYTCRINILGEDLGGALCETEDDCLYNATCTSGICDNTLDDLLLCISENLPLRQRQYLFSQWGYLEEANVDVFSTALNDLYVSDMCISKGSFSFRDHWEFTNEIPTCEDECTVNYEMKCFEKFCDIPEICQTGSEDICYRYWSFITDTGDDCLSESYCNWMACNDTLSQQDCEDECLASTDKVCVSCINSACESFDIFDENTCIQGICSNPNITSESECISEGECSLPCDGCTKEECEALQICSSEYYLDGSSGLCVVPFEFDTYSEAYCDEGEYISGCITTDDEDSCGQNGGVWHRPLSPEECETTFFYCGDPSLYFSDEECDKCDYEILSLYNIEYGVWTPYDWISLEWTDRKFEPIREIGPSLDFITLYDDITTANVPDLAFELTTNINCKYSGIMQLIHPIMCSCEEQQENCFEDIEDSVQSQVRRICPFLEDEIVVSAATTVYVNGDTVSLALPCISITLSEISIIPFRIEEEYRLSSAVFEEPRKNAYSIIRNTDDLLVGQLLVSGLVIESDTIQFEGGLEVCFDYSTSVDHHELYNIPGIAAYDDDTFEVIAVTANTSDSIYCFQFNETGRYFPVVLEEGWETKSQFTIDSYIVVILYLVCGVTAVIQFILANIYHPSKVNATKTVDFILILVISITRSLYFYLDISNVILIYLLFEGPSLLFYSAYSILLEVWVEFLKRTSDLSQRNSSFLKLKIQFTVMNAVLFLVLLVFILIFTFLPETEVDPCSFSDTENISLGLYIMNRVYLGILTALSVVIVIVFIVLGYKMIQIVKNATHSDKKKRSMTLVMIITSLVTVLLIPRMGIYIFFAWNSSVIPILFLGILEFLILLTLIFNLNPDMFLNLCFEPIVDRKRTGQTTKTHRTSREDTIRR